MGIYLLSISHQTTPLEIRSMFVFSQQQQQQMMAALIQTGIIDEVVILSTCNRTELYCHGLSEGVDREPLAVMEQIMIKWGGAQHIAEMGRYLLRYQEQKAVHHLFMVAAGLDSMVIGEDQILGQVKQAYEYSHQSGFIKMYFHTLFRFAITSAKRVKSATMLSKIPISTASLAIKAAIEELGGLQQKKILIIGASGKIGGIVLKNVQTIKDLDVYVTIRNHHPEKHLAAHLTYQTIPYEERYDWLDQMDVVLSATTSPHYTLIKSKVEDAIKTTKKRIFLDLALPLDIEKDVSSLAATRYFNLADISMLAKQNNDKKQADVEAAILIITDYEEQFYKWMLFQNNRDKMSSIKELVLDNVATKGIEAAVHQMFYRIKEHGSLSELESFLSVMQKIIDTTDGV